MAEQRVTYGPWVIYYEPPPIPIRTMDWQFVHRDYDASYEGEEDGYVSNGLSGSAESIEACKREIAEIEDDKGLPSTADAIAAVVAGEVAHFARCLALVHDGSIPGCSCRDVAKRLIARRAA